MAIPQGGFSVAAAGITTPGGAYSYVAAAGYPQYYGGTFLIDTGYDDPVAWSVGVEAAELYGARVYGSSGTVNPNPGAGIFTGNWNIIATPVWRVNFSTSPAANALQRRILIRCDCYLTSPVSEVSGAWQRLDNVDWTLYRL